MFEITGLRKAHGHGSHDFVKDTLLKKATILEKDAEAAIKALKAEKKDAEVAVIQKKEAEIKELATKLQAAKTHDEIEKLEKELAAAESKLYAGKITGNSSFESITSHGLCLQS